MTDKNKTTKEETLIELVRHVLLQDSELREQFQIGEKFRFIRDRLNALLSRLEENLVSIPKESAQTKQTLSEEETIVYVYVYNTQGVSLPTWQKMLNQDVFYELSVNRPIYESQGDINAFIRSKVNKNQHGYLSIAVKKEDILKPESSKDSLNHTLLKVKEGSLHFNKLRSFTHNENHYSVDESGKLKKID